MLFLLGESFAGFVEDPLLFDWHVLLQHGITELVSLLCQSEPRTRCGMVDGFAGQSESCGLGVRRFGPATAIGAFEGH